MFGQQKLTDFKFFLKSLCNLCSLQQDTIAQNTQNNISWDFCGGLCTTNSKAN